MESASTSKKIHYALSFNTNINLIIIIYLIISFKIVEKYTLKSLLFIAFCLKKSIQLRVAQSLFYLSSIFRIIGWPTIDNIWFINDIVVVSSVCQ